MTEIKKIPFKKNCQFYIHQTKKFKSIGIAIIYKLKYSYKNVSAFSLLSKYLGNCCEKYPGIERLNKEIENLYGTSIGIKLEMSGDLLTIGFYANYINPKYVHDVSLHQQVIELLNEMIYHPLLKDGVFDVEMFKICQNATLSAIQASKEYNTRYVVSKLKEKLIGSKKSSMVANRNGDKKMIQSFTNETIVPYYKKLLKAPFDIYVTGEFKQNELVPLIKNRFKMHPSRTFQYNVFSSILSKSQPPLRIVKNTSQAKIAVGYHVPIFFHDKRQYAVRICSLILSGTLSSKFGKVIREQMGLCYQISGSYFGASGSYIVTTGVADENIKKVVDEIENQINEVRLGHVSDDEFLSAKEAMLTNMKMVDDSLYNVLDLYRIYQDFHQEFNLEEEIKKYASVTKKDVIEVAQLFQYVTYVALVRK